MPGIDVDSTREMWGVNNWLDTESGVKAAVKLGKAGLSFADLFGFIDKRDEPYARTYQSLDVTKKALNGIEVIPKVKGLYDKCAKIVTKGPGVATFADAVIAITDLWSSVQEALELIFINMTSEQASLLEQIGGVALGVGMSLLLRKDVIDITDKTAKLAELKVALQAARDAGREGRVTQLEQYIEGLSAQRMGKMIRVAQWVSYIVLSALIIAVAFFSVALAPWAMLAVSTTALVLSIVGHFYKVHAIDPIFQPPKAEIGGDGKGFTVDMLREYCDEGWNERFGEGEGAVARLSTGVGELPKEQENRLRATWRDPVELDALHWRAAGIAAD